MAQRVLPGAYVSLNDLSQLPEGATALTVGYVVQANRGPVNELKMVTSPSDFLAKYTFGGKPAINEDPTFWSILKVLARTNMMYVSRAARNPLYGGIILKKATPAVGSLKSALYNSATESTFLSVTSPEGEVVNILAGTEIMITGTSYKDTLAKEEDIDGYYIVKTDASTETIIPDHAEVVQSIGSDLTDLALNLDTFKSAAQPSGPDVQSFVFTFTNSQWQTSDQTVIGENLDSYGITYSGTPVDTDEITVTYTPQRSDHSDNWEIEIIGKLADDFIASEENSKNARVYRKPSTGITSIEANSFDSISLGLDGKLTINTSGPKSPFLVENNEIIISTMTDKVCTIESVTGNENAVVVAVPKVPVSEVPSSSGTLYVSGISNIGTTEDGSLISYLQGHEAYSMIITGIDPGAYNGEFAFDIVSSVDNPDNMVYYKGAMVGGKECTFDTMTLNVRNGNTGDVLETYLFSLDPEAKDISGNSLYVDNVVSGSAYIKIFHTESTELPLSTVAGMPVYADGGSNGGEVTADDMGKALEPFEDKVVSVSILGNGCSSLAETKKFQQALMGIADTRKDCFVFLNNPTNTENKTLNSEKAQAIVDYKKGDLANTSFYGCMYAPHVSTSDIYNGRDVKIGSEAVAIAGWLGIIDSLSYPYAYAGPRNGLVQGVTCDWKIGDMSGEAQVLNDASINYVAYDGKVGRYYMQCQNTLQVANSSMRNIGTVLNVLDIKEHFTTSLKEYLQLPITDDLRRDIVDTANDYLSPMEGVRFYNYLFQDTSSDFDIADNTLRYLLTIAPTAYAQKIYLVMNIVNATFDFSILQSL